MVERSLLEVLVEEMEASHWKGGGQVLGVAASSSSTCHGGGGVIRVVSTSMLARLFSGEGGERPLGGDETEEEEERLHTGPSCTSFDRPSSVSHASRTAPLVVVAVTSAPAPGA